MTTHADDDAAIRTLLARYCLALDRDDVDSCLAQFVPDLTYRVYGRTYTGQDGLRRMLTRAPGGLHLGGNPVVEIDGDTARTEQNALFVDSATGEARGVVYDDELVRTAAGWRIASRRCRFITPNGLQDSPS